METYTPFRSEWHNSPTPDTPVTAEFLTRLEAILTQITQAVTTVEGASAGASTAAGTAAAQAANALSAATSAAAVAAAAATQVLTRTLTPPVGQDELAYNVKDHGAYGDGINDDRPILQSLLNTAAALGIKSVYLPPGTYYINSATVTGSTGYGLVVPPGVSVRGAGSGLVTFKFGTTPISNLFQIASTLSSTPATITANASAGNVAWTVDTAADIVTGSTVATRITQNGSDPAESRFTVFAQASVSGSVITLDTPSEWALDTTTSLAVNRKLTKVSAIAENMYIGGFHVVGNTNLRHVVGVQWARFLRFEDITGVDVGSGLINAQWCDGCSAKDLYVKSCGAFGNTSKGRGISLSNVRNFLIENLSVDNFDGAAVYIESYSMGVQFKSLRINNRSVARSQAYLIFCGYDCDLYVDGMVVTGWNPADGGTPHDSIVSYGSGPGQASFNNTAIYMPLSRIRAFPIGTATGFFRCFDASGALRTFNMNMVTTSQVTFPLTTGMSGVLGWLRDGLLVKTEVMVTAGIDNTMVTALNIGRTSAGSKALAWTAGSNKAEDRYLGVGVYPIESAFDQDVKITVSTSAVTLPATPQIIVTAYTVQSNNYSTPINGPGSAQPARFLPTHTAP